MPTHIGDVAVAEAIEMTESKLRCSMVVQNYIRYSGHCDVSSDRDGRDRQGSFEMRIDCQNAVHAPCLEKLGILGDQIFSVPVMCREEEVSLLHQHFGSAAENLGVVAFAEFREQDADRLRLQSL
jgi:hypothetical protein